MVKLQPAQKIRLAKLIAYIAAMEAVLLLIFGFVEEALVFTTPKTGLENVDPGPRPLR